MRCLVPAPAEAGQHPVPLLATLVKGEVLMLAEVTYRSPETLWCL